MSQGTIDSVLTQADEIIVAAINEHALPGLAVGIVYGDELIYAKGFGLADTKEEKPVTPDTVFRIGSISKTFTAIGLMQLWEQGRFQLDDPVNDYLKAYRVQHADPNAPPVTFRHILTHTSGIGELRSFSDLLRFRSGFGLAVREGEPIPTLAEYYGGRLTPEVYPEVKWAYGNHAFATLGQLIEDISGEPFPEYMIEHVFEPLGMPHTDYRQSERVRDRLAQGYQFKRGKLTPVEYLEILLPGAGSMFSSVNDMGQYVAALLNGGANEHGAVLKPDTLQLMLEPHYQTDERLPAMGLAFWLENYDGHRIAGHGGGWYGFVSAMLLAPDDHLGVLVFTNTTDQEPVTIAADLMRRLLDIPDPASRLPRPDILETPHLWPELCGFYGPAPGINTNVRIWIGFAGEVEVFVKGNHLAMRTLVGPLRKGIRLYPVDSSDPLAFQAVHEGQVQSVVFKRNVIGRVDRLCAGFFTLYKRPLIESLRFKSMAGLGLLGSLIVAIGWRKLKTKI